MDDLLMHFTRVNGGNFGKLHGMEGTDLREMVLNFKERKNAFLHSPTIACDINAQLTTQGHSQVA